MYEKAAMMFVYAESPLHAGCGSGVGGIDLPIQRERCTNFPIVQPSGLKGVLRQFFEVVDNSVLTQRNTEISVVFGPDEHSASENAGAFCVGEGRLLLFPIRSLKGVFAYATCPIALKRLHRDLELMKQLGNDIIPSSTPSWLSLTENSIPEDQVWVSKPSEGSICKILSLKDKVTLEEFTFSACEKTEVSSLAEWISGRLPGVGLDLASRLVVMPDDAFADFVEFSTEVITRNRINDVTGTVDRDLWTEEYLPRESVLYSLLLSCKPLRSGVEGLQNAADVLKYVTNNSNAALRPNYLWLGGNQTVGRGLVRVVFA